MRLASTKRTFVNFHDVIRICVFSVPSTPNRHFALDVDMRHNHIFMFSRREIDVLAFVDGVIFRAGLTRQNPKSLKSVIKTNTFCKRVKTNFLETAISPTPNAKI